MIISIKVKPNARENKISVENGVINIRIHAPAQDGKANKAVVGYLSEVMNIPKSYIEIVGGQASQHKRIAIADEYKKKVEEFLRDQE